MRRTHQGVQKRGLTCDDRRSGRHTIKNRAPTGETLIHTDHGPQYTSWTFSQGVRAAGLIQSIGTVGDAYDNAVVESFWGTMQIELLN